MHLHDDYDEDDSDQDEKTELLVPILSCFSIISCFGINKLRIPNLSYA